MMEQCFKQKVVSNNQNHTILIVDAFFAYATNGYAQNMVRGVVTDVTGDPLPGVSVVVKVRPQVPLPILTVMLYQCTFHRYINLLIHWYGQTRS